jgi:hypothetical protein
VRDWRAQAAVPVVPRRVGGGFYLAWLFACGGVWCLAECVVPAHQASARRFWARALGVSEGFQTASTLVGALAMVGLAVALCFFTYRIWAAIAPYGQARTTPGKAVGFSFIPFYNLYWVFQAIGGWPKDYNRTLDARCLRAPRAPEGLALGLCVLSLGSLVAVWGWNDTMLVLVILALYAGYIRMASDAANSLTGAEPLPPPDSADSPAGRSALSLATAGLILGGLGAFLYWPPALVNVKRAIEALSEGGRRMGEEALADLATQGAGIVLGLGLTIVGFIFACLALGRSRRVGGHLTARLMAIAALVLATFFWGRVLCIGILLIQAGPSWRMHL